MTLTDNAIGVGAAGPTCDLEEEARTRGYRRVAGLDEAGRGPLAGPVVGAAVIVPRRFLWRSLDDSKTVSPMEREELFSVITESATAWGVGVASEAEIDSLNVLGATRLAWRRAVNQLHVPPDFLLIDGHVGAEFGVPHRSVIHGDRLSCSIAAASILAKVFRDRIMCEYHQRDPRYRFHVHKGYPTPEHLRLLRQFGPSPLHRHSFGPVRRCLLREGA